MVFNQFKKEIQFFLILSPVFPNLMVWSLFSQIQQAPGHDFRMVGKWSRVYTIYALHAFR